MARPPFSVARMKDADSTNCATGFGDAVAIISRPAYTPTGLAAAATRATCRHNHARWCIEPPCSTAASSGFADFLIATVTGTGSLAARSRDRAATAGVCQMRWFLEAFRWLPTPGSFRLGDSAIVRYRVDDSPGLPVPSVRFTAIMDSPHRGHRGALGTRAGVLPCPRCAERLRAGGCLLLVGGMQESASATSSLSRHHHDRRTGGHRAGSGLTTTLGKLTT